MMEVICNETLPELKKKMQLQLRKAYFQFRREKFKDFPIATDHTNRSTKLSKSAIDTTLLET
jgi:hypothetical protein